MAITPEERGASIPDHPRSTNDASCLKRLGYGQALNRGLGLVSAP